MDVREILSGKSRLRRLKGAAKQMWARKSPEPRWRSSYPRGRPAATGRLLTTWTQSLFFENRPEHGAHSNEDEGGESNTGVHRASSRSSLLTPPAPQSSVTTGYTGAERDLQRLPGPGDYRPGFLAVGCSGSLGTLPMKDGCDLPRAASDR